MKIQTTGKPPVDEQTAVFRQLAHAVIGQAFDDLDPALLTQRKMAKWYRSAHSFLRESNEDLEFWCKLAGLNTKAVLEAYAQKRAA